MIDVVSELLACPACGTSYGDTRATRTADALVCGACTHRVPIVRGIPRFADTPDTDEARRTQASFGYEWTHFNDWQPSGQTNFNDYFAGFDLSSLAGKVVLDAGCGTGALAVEAAKRGADVTAVDISPTLIGIAKERLPEVTVSDAALERAGSGGLTRGTAAGPQVHCVRRWPSLSVKRPMMIITKSTKYQIPKPPSVSTNRMPVPTLPT